MPCVLSLFRQMFPNDALDYTNETVEMLTIICVTIKLSELSVCQVNKVSSLNPLTRLNCVNKGRLLQVAEF